MKKTLLTLALTLALAAALLSCKKDEEPPIEPPTPLTMRYTLLSQGGAEVLITRNGGPSTTTEGTANDYQTYVTYASGSDQMTFRVTSVSDQPGNMMLVEDAWPDSSTGSYMVFLANFQLQPYADTTITRTVPF